MLYAQSERDVSSPFFVNHLRQYRVSLVQEDNGHPVGRCEEATLCFRLNGNGRSNHLGGQQYLLPSNIIGWCGIPEAAQWGSRLGSNNVKRARKDSQKECILSYGNKIERTTPKNIYIITFLPLRREEGVLTSAVQEMENVELFDDLRITHFRAQVSFDGSLDEVYWNNR
nr:hypothetical protein Iba_chr03cCG3920 [Ipomoea batatas]